MDLNESFFYFFLMLHAHALHKFMFMVKERGWVGFSGMLVQFQQENEGQELTHQN